MEGSADLRLAMEGRDHVRAPFSGTTLISPGEIENATGASSSQGGLVQLVEVSTPPKKFRRIRERL